MLAPGEMDVDVYSGVKILNTLCVCIVLTDAALLSQHGPRVMPHHRRILFTCLAINTLVAVGWALQDVRVVRLLSLPITLVQMLSHLAVGWLGGASVLSALIAALATALCRKTLLRRTSGLSSLIGWAGFAVLLRLAQLLAGVEPPEQVVELLESMMVVASVFGLLSYWDVRHCVRPLAASKFVGFVAVGVAEAVLLLPLITVLAACVAMAFVAVSEVLGVPVDWLQQPVYWLCLYGPFGSVYFLTMRQARLSLLPR